MRQVTRSPVTRAQTRAPSTGNLIVQAQTRVKKLINNRLAYDAADNGRELRGCLARVPPEQKIQIT